METELLTRIWADLLTAFTNPQKRVFWGYLFASMLLAFGWLCFCQRQSLIQSWSALFSPKVWWSRSARADYQLFLLNRLLMLLLAPWMLARLSLTTWLFYQLYDLFGQRPVLAQDWPDWLVMTLFTLVYFLLDDFSRFFLHRLLHRVPWLWAFHKVHHTATRMTPMTVFRTHPVEAVLFSLRSVLVQGGSIAMFVFFCGERADLITVFGVSMAAFLFNITGANLRHSHIAIRYWPWLERWLISPAQHQLHHSSKPRHFDSNYGVVLAVWDGLGGSLLASEQGILRFGLHRKQRSGQLHGLGQLYLGPVKEVWQLLKLTLGYPSKTNIDLGQ